MLFITGSESFIGKKLIEICKKNKISYFGVDGNTKNNSNSKKIDIRDKNLFKYIPYNSTIIHLAAISNNKDCDSKPYLCIDVNVNGTLNLISLSTASFENGVLKKIIPFDFTYIINLNSSFSDNEWFFIMSNIFSFV